MEHLFRYLNQKIHTLKQVYTGNKVRTKQGDNTASQFEDRGLTGIQSNSRLESQSNSPEVGHADINDIFIQKLTQKLREKIAWANNNMHAIYPHQRRYSNIKQDCEAALENIAGGDQYVRHSDEAPRRETVVDRLIKMKDRNATLAEIFKETKREYEKAEKAYSDFKTNQAKDKIKDVDALIERLRQNYSQEDRSLMMKAHLKDVYGRHLDMGPDQHEQFITLQKAFVAVRGMDFDEILQQVQPLSSDQIKAIIEDHGKRYEIDYEDTDDYDPEIGPRVCTAVKGDSPCYTNLIALKEETASDRSTLLYGSLTFLGNYKSRPNEAEPETLIYESSDEDEVNEVYDNDRQIPGMKPLFHTHITYNQIRFKVNDSGSDMSKFRLSSPISGCDIRNRETIRTMSLFVEQGTSKKFKKGEHGYYAALGTRPGKGKGRLLAEYFPQLEIPQIEVKNISSKRIGSMDYTLAHKS